MDGRRADRLIRDDVDDDVCIGRARVGLMEKTDGRTDGECVRSYLVAVAHVVEFGIGFGMEAHSCSRRVLPIPFPLCTRICALLSLGIRVRTSESVGRSVGRTLTKRRAKSKAAAAEAATVTPTTRRGRRRAVVSFLNESRVWLSGCGRIGGVRLCREIFVVGLLE